MNLRTIGGEVFRGGMAVGPFLGAAFTVPVSLEALKSGDLQVKDPPGKYWSGRSTSERPSANGNWTESRRQGVLSDPEQFSLSSPPQKSHGLPLAFM